MKKFIAVGLLAAAVIAAWLQRNAIAALRQSNAELRQQAADSAQLAITVRGAPAQSDDQAMQHLAEAAKELPRLRNEVRQLRQHKPEIERLRQENSQLTAQAATAPNRPKLAEMEGYVAREQWAQAGFATPDAAVQSFFWAIANQDFDFLAQCMSPKMQADFQKSLEGKTPEEMAATFQKGIGEFAKLGGYRVAERRQRNEGSVELGIQAAAGGHIMPMRLIRSAEGEWKLDVR